MGVRCAADQGRYGDYSALRKAHVETTARTSVWQLRGVKSKPVDPATRWRDNFIELKTKMICRRSQCTSWSTADCAPVSNSGAARVLRGVRHKPAPDEGRSKGGRLRGLRRWAA